MNKSILYLISLLLLSLDIQAQDKLFSVDDSYMSRHDIVYLDPEYEGYNGFPLGNGDMGGLLWLSDHGLEVQLNKIDLYEIPQKERMTLRSAGRLKIDFGAPCFEYLYLKDFNARLSLKDATATINSVTPFSNVKINSWVDTHSNVWMFDCMLDKLGSATPEAASVSLSRWGSRDFGTWYSVYDKDASHGLGHSKASIHGNDILVCDSFAGGVSFCMACRVLSVNGSSDIQNEHSAAFNMKLSGKNHFEVLVSISTSNDAADVVSHSIELLDEAQRKGLSALKDEHTQWWQKFWKKSFVHLGNDYFENIYYLRRYLMASASRGKYLSPFNGSLWVWNHDIRQWVTPHHWNTQESYWGLAEENDCDLMKPYIDTYYRLMPQAEAYAMKRGVKDAILWTEAHDFAGKMVSADWGNMVNDFTPASQIASIFWEYYEHTGNKRCLQDTIYPFMKKAAQFYLKYLKWDETKHQYYIFPSQPYEHEHNTLKNCITDRYMIESLFGHCIKAARILNVDKKKVSEWKAVVSHLWEPPILNVPGIGDIFGLAYYKDGSLYPKPEQYLSYSMAHYYTFAAHTTAVFPADVMGLDQKGTRYFDIACRLALRHPAHINAISPGPIVAARLGLADKANEHLGNMIAYLQHFNQGLFYNIDHWNKLSRYASKIDSSALYTQRDYVFDRRVGYDSKYAGSSGLWAYPFIQSGMETIGIFGATVNEMLMQSHENKIRVFPATPASWNAAFKLLARGGFMVSASKDSLDCVKGVEIVSRLGGVCRLQNPWNGHQPVIVSNGKHISFKLDKKGVIAFETAKGHRYLITDKISGPSSVLSFGSAPNQSPKHYSEAVLGKDRTYRREP